MFVKVKISKDKFEHSLLIPRLFFTWCKLFFDSGGGEVAKLFCYFVTSYNTHSGFMVFTEKCQDKK